MSNGKMFIFLHGYNAQGDAMRVVENVFQKIAPKKSVFLYPNAPFKAPEGDGFCWFPFVFGDAPFAINEEFVYQSMDQAMPYLSSYIKQKLDEYSEFSYKDIILVGFSQGAALSLHASMKLEEQICCAISFSGGLANPNNAILKEDIKKCPLLLIHGVDDQILPYQFSLRGEKMLKRADFDVEFHLLKDTKHLITPECIDIAGRFIKRVVRE